MNNKKDQNSYISKDYNKYTIEKLKESPSPQNESKLEEITVKQKRVYAKDLKAKKDSESDSIGKEKSKIHKERKQTRNKTVCRTNVENKSDSLKRVAKTNNVEETLIVKKSRAKKAESTEEELTVMYDRFTRISEIAQHCKKYVGAHVSMAGGIEHAIYNSVRIGGQSFALFLKSQRRWESVALEDDRVAAFKKAISFYKYDSSKILPHGSYLVNLGSPRRDLLEKGRQAFLDDVDRCGRLGITLYNFHPGSTTGEGTKEECISAIAESINIAHIANNSIVCLIENMSGQGFTIGGDFRDLALIIEHVRDKSRVGVCLDTCHLFAYGYDISTAEKFDGIMKQFDSIVGLKFLRAMHINDSKSKLGSKKDLHENIGKGHIGIEAFKFIMNDHRFDHIPLILETPVGDENQWSVYQNEIDLLYSLVDIKTFS